MTEYERLKQQFANTTPEIQAMAEGLIQKASYLSGLCEQLEQAINQAGAIRVNPDNPKQQRPVTAVKEYARLTEAYANIINRLNKMCSGNQIEEDDELGEFDDAK
jgi:hypothetical protein